MADGHPPSRAGAGRAGIVPFIRAAAGRRESAEAPAADEQPAARPPNQLAVGQPTSGPPARGEPPPAETRTSSAAVAGLLRNAAGEAEHTERSGVRADPLDQSSLARTHSSAVATASASQGRRTARISSCARRPGRPAPRSAATPAHDRVELRRSVAVDEVRVGADRPPDTQPGRAVALRQRGDRHHLGPRLSAVSAIGSSPYDALR